MAIASLVDIEVIESDVFGRVPLNAFQFELVLGSLAYLLGAAGD